VDAAGNKGDGHGELYGVDSSENSLVFLRSPTILQKISISGTSGALNGLLNAGDTVQFTAGFSRNVTVGTGSGINLAIQVGSNARVASYMSGSDTSSLVFSYTVRSGDTGDISINLNALTLAGGSRIYDEYGASALVGSAPVVATGKFITDTTISAPSVSVGQTSASISTGQTDIAYWEYSVDSGATWIKRASSDTTTNSYVAGQTPIVRLTDKAGNTSAYSSSGSASRSNPITFSSGWDSNVGRPLKTGSEVYLYMDMGTDISVTGSPTLNIQVGTSTRVASYVGIDGTTKLKFRYTVAVGDSGAISVGANAYVFNGGTISGSGGQNISALIEATSSSASSAPRVDGIAPSAPVITVSSSNHMIYVSGIEDGATWDYSTNGGISYLQPSAGQFSFGIGTNAYAANSIIVRQIDSAGNITPTSYGVALQVPAAKITGVNIEGKGAPVGNLLNGDDYILVTLTMSEAVRISGSARLSLKIGSQSVYASYMSNLANSESELVFAYNTAASDAVNGAVALNVSGGTALDLQGSSFQDYAGNIVSTAMSAQSSSYTYDTAGPTQLFATASQGLYSLTNPRDIEAGWGYTAQYRSTLNNAISSETIKLSSGTTSFSLSSTNTLNLVGVRINNYDNAGNVTQSTAF
jgi:hypothetical protein